VGVGAGKERGREGEREREREREKGVQLRKQESRRIGQRRSKIYYINSACAKARPLSIRDKVHAPWMGHKTRHEIECFLT
jgi:hypothetical protein